MGDNLVDVEIATHEGATYKFPDMPCSTLEAVVRRSGWEANGVLVLVNVSGAALSLPARVVKTLSWDGEEKYHGPRVY